MKLKPFAVLILLFQTIASAAPTEHGPFTETNRPATVALRKLAPSEEMDGMVSFQDTDQNKTVIRVSSAGDFLFVEIADAGHIRFPNSRICSAGMLGFVSVYAADLNLDGKTDYVVTTPTGGNGLNADCSYITFLLSSGQGFTLKSTDTFGFDVTDFILIGGKPRFVKASFGQVKRCKDRKPHSFWIYNLLSFDRGTAQLDNSGLPGFPKVIWYSDNPNHEETTLLTARQKAELIKRSLPSEN